MAADVATTSFWQDMLHVTVSKGCAASAQCAGPDGATLHTQNERWTRACLLTRWRSTVCACWNCCILTNVPIRVQEFWSRLCGVGVLVCGVVRFDRLSTVYSTVVAWHP